jgi:pimeloyl-ACP methyl ester carboxylesterase
LPALKKRLLANDMDALIAVQQYRSDHDDEVADALLTLPCPYMLIAGDADPIAPYSEIAEYAKTLPGEPPPRNGHGSP